MQPPFPALTDNWHNDTYPAIDPRRPELSVGGKTIIVIGAGEGSLGKDVAVAFAAAGAKHIALLGRTQSRLEATQAAVGNTKASTSLHVADICEFKTLAQTFDPICSWDILVLAAGNSIPGKPITGSDPEEWWSNYELQVRGTFNVLQALLPKAAGSGSVLVSLFSGASCMPSQILASLSGYIPSKIAQAKLIEIVGAEHPSIRVMNVHPGMVATAGFKKGGHDENRLPMDTHELGAHFIVWACSSEAEFLKGKTVFANWDVEEMKIKKESIVGTQLLTNGNLGWPFT